jgi:hypothetical protein
MTSLGVPSSFNIIKLFISRDGWLSMLIDKYILSNFNGMVMSGREGGQKRLIDSASIDTTDTSICICGYGNGTMNN